MAVSTFARKPLDPHRGIFPVDRLDALRETSPQTRALTDELIVLAKRGLPAMHQNGFFPHTMRLITKGDERTVRPEGDSLRYAINCGLGLSFISEAEQRQILGGSSARDVILATAKRAETSDDPGAVALAAWTAAEAENIFTARLFERLTDLLASRQPVATVDCSWMLIAAVAARKLGDTYDLAVMAKERLMAAQGAYGLFPHRLPASSNGKLRAHIGCFADQVYSTQGLARFAVAYQDQAALVAADACGARICQLQGPDGQWWWHYDVRNGTVVEGYPVYSVHQHAMAPMALLDLREAGGVDHMGALVKGLQWLVRHPEVSEPMICEQDAVIWRKAARREPKKAVRALSAVTTALKPGLHLPGLDRAFPPNQVDHECRPYELGWLLYAWLSGGVVANS